MPAGLTQTQVPGAADREKGRVALKAFFNIADKWGCSVQEQRRLLGDISRSTLYGYRRHPARKLDRDTMERISCLMGIYKALQILYPTSDIADTRLRRPTDDLPFNGASPMEFILRGSMMHLADSRRYFDHRAGN